jgi:hypothetical protein
VGAVVDLDRGDRIEGQDVADHEIDAFAHDAAQPPPPRGDAEPRRRVGELGERRASREGAVVAAEGDIERP